MAFPWLGMILQALPTFPEDVHPYGDLYDRVASCTRMTEKDAMSRGPKRWIFCFKTGVINLAISGGSNVHPGKLTSQWKTNCLKMYLLLESVIFRCHVS